MHNPGTIVVIESYLKKCLNVTDGNCDMTWKHDDCKILMQILYELTEDDKYVEKEWKFDINQRSLWG